MKRFNEPIQHALGIQTRDLITTSYNTGPYIVRDIHGPFTYFKGIGSLVILDHPEISLTLSPDPSKSESAAAYINNLRQVNDRWFTASNDEIFITRPEPPSALPQNLLEIIHPPDKIEYLPTPPYQFDPAVNYSAGPRRVWRCETCNVDFNAIPTNRSWCKHDCKSQTIAQQIFYVRAPEPDDRKAYISYYVMTLNSQEYGPTVYQAAAAIA